MQFIIYGIVTGSILLLATVGFAMVKRVENFLNIGHAELLTVGAYIAYYFNVQLGINIFMAGLIAVVLTALVSLLVARLVYEPIRKYGHVILLITSVGVAYILHGLNEAISGVEIRSYAIPVTKAIQIAGKPFMTIEEIVVILIAGFSAVGLHLFLTGTKTGKAIRAMSSNFDLARVRGIETKRMAAYVWLVSGGLAGLAGILLGATGRINTDLGWSQILIILSAAILGGLSSIYGVMIAALLIGIAMDTSVIFFPPAYRQAVAFVLIIIVLFLRPKGIMGGGAK
ncbi:MAG: branched-chain amino acid ABC transporter permease [Firmicutes bacterium]|nr:branched-chain amino acid ABC transporter permease [Bacillota bacterium]